MAEDNCDAEIAEERKSGSVQVRFLPFDITCLYPETDAPCDLYLRVEGGRHTLFVQRGMHFGSDEAERLHESGVDQLFFREEDATHYYSYLKDNLSRLVQDPSRPETYKAQLVHVACKDIMTRVLADPRAPFLGHAEGIIRPAVDLITSSHSATRALIRLTEYDPDIFIHSTNVGIFSVALARLGLGASPEELLKIAPAFFLHDLGKCDVPAEVLNKPGPLDDAEWILIHGHPEGGLKLAAEADCLSEEGRLVLMQHHERDDGSGYPYGLKGKDISPYARVCRLADAFEAMTSDRPYRRRMSTFHALKNLKRQVISEQDQAIFEKFIKLFSM